MACCPRAVTQRLWLGAIICVAQKEQAKHAQSKHRVCRHPPNFPDLLNPQNRPRGQSPPQLPLLNSSNTMRSLSLLLAILAMVSATVQVKRAAEGSGEHFLGGSF